MEKNIQVEADIVNTESVAYDPKLSSLWRKHHFKGNPPPSGSESESRLKELCSNYAILAVYGEKAPSAMPINLDHTRGGGGEDYFSEMRAKQAIDELRNSGNKEKFNRAFDLADSKRKELHDQIVLMTIGKDRSNVSTVRSEEITDFACELNFGMDYERALNASESNQLKF